MNPHAQAQYRERLHEVKEAIHYHTPGQRDALWETAEGVATLFSHVSTGDLKSLEQILDLELSFSKWFVEIPEPDMGRVIGAVETLAAFLEAKGSLQEVDESICNVLGAERVSLQLVEWFELHAPFFNVENGHVHLAKALGPKAVYHAGKSGDKGIHEFVWEKIGRHWEWMKGHPGGFVAAGRELTSIGRVEVGRILLQHAHLGVKAVALRLAAQGGDDMGLEVRDELGLEPFAGDKLVHPAFELGLDVGEEHIVALEALDGSRVATGGVVIVKIWNLETGFCESSLPGHTALIRALAARGDLLVSGGDDKTIRTWDLSTGQCQHVLDTQERVLTLVLASDATLIHGGSTGVSCWKLGADAQWSGRRRLKGHTFAVSCLALLSNGRIASGALDGTIVVHDLATGDIAKVLKSHTDTVSALNQLLDGRLVSTSHDSTFRVWPLNLEDDPSTLFTHRNDYYLYDVCVYEDGAIALIGQEGELMLGSVEGSSFSLSGAVVRVDPRGARAVIALDRRRTLTLGDYGGVSLWDFDAPSETFAQPHAEGFYIGTVLPSGKIVTAGRRSGELALWSKPVKGQLPHFERLIEGVRSLHIRCLVGTSAGLVVWGDDEPSLHLIRHTGEVKILGEVDGWLGGLAVMDDGKTVIAASEGAIKAWDVEKLKEMWSLEAEDATRVCVVDQYRAAVAVGSGGVKVVNFQTGQEEVTLKMGEETLLSLACDGNGTIAGQGGGRLWLADVKQGTAPTLVEEPEEVFGLYASLGDGNLIICFNVRELAVWNLTTREVIGVLGGLDDWWTTSISWNPKDRTAVVFYESSWIAYQL